MPAMRCGSRRAARIAPRGVLAVVVVLLVSCSAGSDTSATGSPWPGWGFTHTQFSADHGVARSVTAVRQALADRPVVQNQHIMGWGAENPEPAPGVYRFDSLDDRINFIRSTGGTPVITLCCAPDWMKGGRPGQTDWDRLTTAPQPEHYGDFAELSATIARRYPDVRHFLVWNEFKGFFDEKNNRWDAAGYTDLYNQVYSALKEVDPRNQVGGPYLDMAGPPAGATRYDSQLRGSWGTVDQRTLDAFTYWLDNNDGADFVVVDGHSENTDGAPDETPGGTTDEFAEVRKFSAVSRWVEARTDLPLWWAEWYVEPPGSGWSGPRQTAVRTAAMMEMAKSGVSTALYWNPRPRGPDCATCLWTDTGAPNGGAPLPFLTTVLQNFAQWFPPGTPLQDVRAPAALRVLAQPRMLLVVNTTPQPVTASFDGRQQHLAGYETRWIPRPA